jgi:hypothetical protein
MLNSTTCSPGFPKKENGKTLHCEDKYMGWACGQVT